MRTPSPSLSFASCVLLASLLTAQDQPDLRTVAEKSDWQATATHAEVMQLCADLAESSPRIHMEIVGETFEKKPLPILVIADPPVASPAEVGDRLVAFAWAGIHSGEVCGKPATLMLAREMAASQSHPLLEKLVVVFLPLLNADGNDRMDPNNRRGQVGPVQGMGTRANAQGLNINRDWTKLDTSEAVAVVNVLNTWDPVIAMDLHTTNGTRHRYTLTYDGQRHPACDDGLRRLTRYDLLPSVTWSIERATGYRTTVYGNLNRDRTRWTIDDALPRYSTHYVGMRHHISILSEAYSYAEYEDRVMATLAFVRHSFQWVSDHAEQVRSTIQAAKDRTVALGQDPQADDMLPLRRQRKYSDAKINILA
ncbi:MAG: M14 family metallopeptidase, partial [Planctomycetota bacterium]